MTTTETKNIPVLEPKGRRRVKVFKKFRKHHRLAMFNKLAMVLRQPGTSLVVTMEDLFWRAYNRRKSSYEAIALNIAVRSLHHGDHVSEALSNLVEPIERMLISGGETGRTNAQSSDTNTALQRAFARCEKRLRDEMAARKETKSGLISASVYFVMAVGSLLAVAYLVVPVITSMYPLDHWSFLPKSMYYASLFVKSWPFTVFVLLLIAAMIAYPISLPKWRGKIRNFLDRYPPYSFYRLQEGGGWLLAIPAITEGGHIKAYDAVGQTAKVAQPWLKEKIMAVIRAMDTGKVFGDALHATGFNFPDREVVNDIRLYEKNGLDIDTVLKSIAADWEEVGIAEIKKQAARLKMASIVAFALVVGWFAICTSILQLEIPRYFMSMAAGGHY